MSPGITEIALSTRIAFTDHATLRYIERVRPGLPEEAAGENLAQVAQFGQIRSRPPTWMAWDGRAPLFLEVADAVFPLRPSRTREDIFEAVTCLVRDHGWERKKRRQPTSKGRRRRG